MSKWTIYRNVDGFPVEVAVCDSLEYSGSWMGECFVTLNVRSEAPIDFHIGDYVTYREELFVINYDPSVIKKARRGTYGEGFTYDSIKFNALQTELTDIMFYDYVLYDNNLHYTSLPVFPFYAKDIDDYCDRLQANTNRYCKDNNFQMSDYWLFITPTCDSNNVPVRTIQRAQTFGLSSGEATARWQAIYGVDGSGVSTDDMKGDVAVNISNETVWNALTRIKNDFGLNFITRGREVIVGSAGLPTNHVFKYGKDEGLYELERVADSEQQIITKLWAYGSDKNMPIRYYANLTKLAYVSGTKEERTGQGYTEYWIRTSIPFADIKSALLRDDTLCTLKYGNITCQAVMDPEGGPTVIRLLHESGSSEDQALYNAYVNGEKIYVTAGVDIDKWPNSEYTGGGLPNNMAVNRLMLPGFPLQSLYDWVLENDGVAVLDDDDNPIIISEGGVDVQGLATWHGYTAWFSCDRTRPFIVSQNYSELGIRESSKYFDGSSDDDEIYPSIENAPNNADKITSADMITDNGVFGESDDASVPMFSVTLPNISSEFKLDEQIEIGKSRGESPVIAMKDGYCGGRELKINSVTHNGDGTWTCECEREHDDLLDLYFPYSYHVSIGQAPMANEPYQICAGDKYVLTGIPMTKAYIDFGAERLLEAALLFLSKNDYVRYTYVPKVDEIFMARQHQQWVDDPQTTTRSLYMTIKEGDIMLFEDADLLIEGSVFIDTLQIRENGNSFIPTFEVTLRDDKEVGTIQRMQEQISSYVSGGGGNGGSSSGSGGGGGVNTNQIKNLIEAYGKEFFLSKLVDDTANGLITFVKGLVSKADLVVEGNGWFKKMLTAVSAVIDNIRSSNFSGWGVADAGYQLTSDYNGTGKSGLVVDYIYARMKLVAEALELKKYEVSAGDQMYSMAANYINRTEYLTDEDVSVGWSEEKAPWLLRGMPLTLRKTLTGNQVFGIFARKKKIRMHLSNTDVSTITKVRCYFLAKDGDRDVENWWRVGDLARCQTLNVVSSKRDDYVSVERKAGNVFWWRKVIGVSTNAGSITWKNKETGEVIDNDTYDDLPTQEEKDQYIRNYNGTKTDENEEHSGLPVTIDGKDYHWIDIAYSYDEEHAGPDGAETEWAGAAILSDIPCAGDTAVQFGHDSDPNRMNLMTLELNGLMNADAPCIKIYKGIYTYDMNKCWWGGKARKMLLSPSTGYEFYGPSFKFIEEYGIARVPNDRGAWSDITPTRSDYEDNGEHPLVRRCYYYDRVSHNGSLWLCVASSLETGDAAHWVKPQEWDDEDYVLFDANGNYRFNGDYITDLQYNGVDPIDGQTITDAQRAQCGRVQDYIISEPSENSAEWEKQVAKGDAGSAGAFKSRVFIRQNTQPSTPDWHKTLKEGSVYYNTYDYPLPPPTVLISRIETWSDGIPQGDAILWSSVCTFYADGTNSHWSTPAAETDTADLDLEFSPSTNEPNPPQGNIPFADHSSEGWYDPSHLPSGQTMIWRAERKVKNGAYVAGESWVITRIYGESGTSAPDFFTLEIDPQSIVNNDSFASGTTKTVYFNAYKNSNGTATKLTFGSGGKCNEDANIYAAYKVNTASGWTALTGNSCVISKQQADANDNVIFELRKVNSGSTYNRDNSDTYTVINRRTLQILKDGDAGEDAVNVIATPASIIVNQDIETPNNLSNLSGDQSARVVFSVMKGSAELTVSAVQVYSTSQCTATGSSSYYAQVTSILKDSQDKYYNTAFFLCTITYSDGGTSKTVTGIKVTIYANLLGDWAVATVNGATTAAGNLIETALGPDGAITTAIEGQVEISAKGLHSEFSEQLTRAGQYNCNLFGFNKGILIQTYLSNVAGIPFIQGYGIIANGEIDESWRGVRMRYLGFDGVGGSFVVSFQAKIPTAQSEAKFRARLCMVNATYIKRGSTELPEGQVEAAIDTTWYSYEFRFYLPDTNQYIGGDYNGFLDIYGNWVSSGQQIYIRHLKIERGDEATTFVEADEDIANIGKGQLITGLTLNNTYNGSVIGSVIAQSFTIQNVGTFDGYGGNINISALASDGYIDILRQEAIANITAGKIYTLSYWAKGTNSPVIRNYLYRGGYSIITSVAESIYDPGTSGNTVEGVQDNGSTIVRLSTSWKQYFVRFYATNNVPSANLITLRVYKSLNTDISNSDISICDIQFQEGYVMADSQFSSLIQQSARRITLLQQTGLELAGVNIEKGTVDLIGNRVNFTSPNLTPYIKVGLRQVNYNNTTVQMPYFIFLAPDGVTELYNLGLTGIREIANTSHQEQYIPFEFIAFAVSGGISVIDDDDDIDAKALYLLSDYSGSASPMAAEEVYQFEEGWFKSGSPQQTFYTISGSTSPSACNGAFLSQKTADQAVTYKIPAGWYFEYTGMSNYFTKNYRVKKIDSNGKVVKDFSAIAEKFIDSNTNTLWSQITTAWSYRCCVEKNGRAAWGYDYENGTPAEPMMTLENL